jgi:type II secretory pathway component GspD/PulD (secretin)
MTRNVGIPFGILASLFALALVLPGGVARAGEENDPEAYRSLDVGDGLVTLDVQGAPFLQVVQERIQPRTRVNIDVSPEAADQPVTIRMVDLHWIHVLDSMTEKIGGVMVRPAPNLLRIVRPTPVTISITDGNIKEVISAIAKLAGDVSVIVAPTVQGTITLSLHDVPWREALEQVVRTLKFALVQEEYGILRVVPLSDLELEEDYYRFRYLRPHAPYKGVIATQGGGGGGGSSGGGGGGGTGTTGSGGGSTPGATVVRGNPYVPSDDPSEAEANFPIVANLRQIVKPEGGDVMYMPLENTIIFTGTKPKIQRLSRMAHQLDTEPPQVFVDMNFVVTSNSDALNLGLDAGKTTGIGMGLSGANIMHMLPFNVGGGINDIASNLTGTAFPPPLAGTFSYGRLGTSETSLLWKYLQRDISTRVVQSPKLLALDNQEATIFIGDSVRYARSEAATNQNGGLTFSVEEDPNSPVNVGFQLLVIPHVIPGENKIMLTVIPIQRALTGTGTGSGVPEGFDVFTVSGQEIALPRVQSTTMVTHMILRSGETAVIGGLLKDRDTQGVDKVPLLGDIPILGLIFQGKTSAKVKENLLITITPRILRGSDAANCVISDELMRGERVSAEYTDLYGRAAQTPRPPAPPPPPPPGPMPMAPGR